MITNKYANTMAKVTHASVKKIEQQYRQSERKNYIFPRIDSENKKKRNLDESLDSLKK